MKIEDRAIISRKRKRETFKLCPSSVLPMRRPRVFWPSWNLPEVSDAAVKEKDGFTEVVPQAKAVPVRSFLKGDEAVDEKFAGFPCFMRALRRSGPPLAPRGIHECTTEELERWRKENHEYAPYQFQKVNLIKNRRTGRLYTPPADM